MGRILRKQSGKLGEADASVDVSGVRSKLKLQEIGALKSFEC